VVRLRLHGLHDGQYRAARHVGLRRRVPDVELWLYRRIIFGRLEKASLAGIFDMGLREKVILVPLVALTILFGVYPQPIMRVTAASVDQLVANYQAAIDSAALANMAAQ
jgi:NADH-quinone oxidoreductase subunit M